MDVYERDTFKSKETGEEYRIIKFEEWQRQEKINYRKNTLRCLWFFGNMKNGMKTSLKERFMG